MTYNQQIAIIIVLSLLLISQFIHHISIERQINNQQGQLSALLSDYRTTRIQVLNNRRMLEVTHKEDTSATSPNEG